MAPIVLGFDVGETLLTYAGIPPNWIEHYSAALTAAASSCSIVPSPGDLLRAGDTLARHNTRLHPRIVEIRAETIFREILSGWSVDPQRYLTGAIEAFFGFFQQRLTPYPESFDAITGLQRQGMRLGVLTDVPYGMPPPFVWRDLAGAGLDSQWNVVLTSVDVGWRKPAAAGFLALAEKLQATPDQLWFVGNEEKDIAGAITAGATAILIDRQNQQPEWGQRHTIRSLDELVPLVGART